MVGGQEMAGDDVSFVPDYLSAPVPRPPLALLPSSHLYSSSYGNSQDEDDGAQAAPPAIFRRRRQ